MSKITFYFVRHGQTLFNFEEKVQGWSDSFLTPNGIAGVQSLGKFWAEEQKRFNRVYSSDSGRTLQTSRILLEELGVKQEIIPTPGFREYNFGSYEGGPDATLAKEVFTEIEIDSMYSLTLENATLYLDTISELDRKKKNGETNTWYAETSAAYIQRLTTTLTTVVNDNLDLGNEEILVVSHGMSILTLVCAICAADLHGFDITGLENASVTEVTYENGRFKLIAFGTVVA